MPVTDIKEIRILPALAAGRFGSSPDPMDNYNVQADPNDLTGFQQLVPAETLVVDRNTGEITGIVTPAAPLKFRDAQGRVRPVAPFFEVWARFADDGALEPLTIAHLADLQLTPTDVQWRVRAANHKAFRRTGDLNDKIDADTSAFTDHTIKEVRGAAANFKTGKLISFGAVQYIKLTANFPEIRLRFTPLPARFTAHATAIRTSLTTFTTPGVADGTATSTAAAATLSSPTRLAFTLRTTGSVSAILMTLVMASSSDASEG